MTSRDASTDPVIEQLEQLGAALEFPPTPAIAEEVAAAFHPEPRRIWWLPYSLVAAALAIALIANPQVRGAVWDWLEVAGIELRILDTQPTGEELPLLDEALFGSPASKDDAEAAFGRPLAVPNVVLPKTPDAVYVKNEEGGMVAVTFVYPASESLPAIGDSEYGAVLTQIGGPTDSPFFLKFMLDFDHQIYVSETGLQMQWIERGQLASADEPEAWRSSANVLIWGDANAGYRLESGLTQEESEEIAESMSAEQGNLIGSSTVFGVSTLGDYVRRYS